MSQRTVLVTGATGKQGGAVARALLKAGHAVRGLTRNPASEAARTFADRGGALVKGDFSDPDSIRAAVAGGDTVFAMSTPFEAGVEAETAQGIALVDAAVEAGISHFVYTSVASADQNTGIPHFDSKFAVEQHLASTDLSWSVIAPVYFMENLFLPQTMEGLNNGVYAVPMPPDVPLQQVAVEDIGSFGAYVVSNRDAFLGQRIDIAGDELTGGETAELLSQVMGRSVSFAQVPMEQIRAFMEDLTLMYEWFISTGYSADVAGLREAYPEVGWHRFAEWAETAVNAQA